MHMHRIISLIDFVAVSYRYVDVAITSVLTFFFAAGAGILDFIIAYDIACKYSIKFEARVTEFESMLLPSTFFGTAWIIWLIGKFHLGGHRDDCHKKFSFNYTANVGRMSGELVETIWSYFDYLKYQTREMSAGARKEMLSDAMNWWNWQKVVKIGDVTSASVVVRVRTDDLTSRFSG